MAKYSILLLHPEDYTFFHESIQRSFGVDATTLQNGSELRMIFTVPDKPLLAHQQAFLNEEAYDSRRI